MSTSRFKFHKVGVMSYEVSFNKSDAEVLGSIWRTTEGWMIAPIGGTQREVYGVSRNTAAGVMQQARMAVEARARIAAAEVADKARAAVTDRANAILDGAAKASPTGQILTPTESAEYDAREAHRKALAPADYPAHANECVTCARYEVAAARRNKARQDGYSRNARNQRIAATRLATWLDLLGRATSAADRQAAIEAGATRVTITDPEARGVFGQSGVIVREPTEDDHRAKVILDSGDYAWPLRGSYTPEVPVYARTIEFTSTTEEGAKLARRLLINAGHDVSLIGYDGSRRVYAFDQLS